MAPGEEPEFDLRHDHNSMLGDEHVGRFPDWTDEYWVPADRAVEYLNAFQQPQSEAGRIRYCQEVDEVKPRQCTHKPKKDTTLTPRFELNVTSFKPCDDKLNAAVKEKGFSAGEGRESQLPGMTSVSRVCCGVVVMAHGMSVPNVPGDWIADLDKLSVGYEDLDRVLPTAKDALGKSVLILGGGNAAYETADNLRNYAADIQVAARRQTDLMARTSKYIGNVRGRRTTAFDAFHLKSYEGISRLADDEGYEEHGDVVRAARKKGITRYALIACNRGRARGGDYDHRDPESFPAPLSAYMMGAGNSSGVGSNSSAAKIPDVAACIMERDLRDGAVILGAWDKENPVMKRAAKVIPGFKQRKPTPYLKKYYSKLGVPPPTLAVAPFESLRGANSTDELRTLLPELVEATDGVTQVSSPGDMRKPWDIVIRHLGWKMDRSLVKSLNISMMDVREQRVYNDGRGAWKADDVHEKDEEPLTSTRPARYTGNYPALSPSYESTSCHHLFFAGANAHGLDRWRYQSAGGFMHGYRFTARALWRVLESRYHGDAWADGETKFPWRYEYFREAHKGYKHLKARRPIWGFLMTRINSMAGPYNMLGGSLADCIVFKKTGNKTGEAVYYQEMPEDLIHQRFSEYPRMVIMYNYGPHETYPPWGAIGATHNPGQPTAIDKTYSPFVNVFHPVLEYFPAKQVLQRPKAEWFNRQEGGGTPASARWTPSRGSSRYHLQGDRHLDWTTRNFLPGLERFLLAVEEASWRGRPIARRFDEVLDVRWNRLFADQFGDTLPDYRGMHAAEPATKKNYKYWEELAIEAAELEEEHLARAYVQEAIALRPKEAQAHFILGALDAKANRAKEALANFRRTLDLDPKHENARNNVEVLEKQVFT